MSGLGSLVLPSSLQVRAFALPAVYAMLAFSFCSALRRGLRANQPQGNSQVTSDEDNVEWREASGCFWSFYGRAARRNGALEAIGGAVLLLRGGHPHVCPWKSGYLSTSQSAHHPPSTTPRIICMIFEKSICGAGGAAVQLCKNHVSPVARIQAKLLCGKPFEVQSQKRQD